MKFYHAPRAVNPERVAMFLRAKGTLDAVELEEISIMEAAILPVADAGAGRLHTDHGEPGDL